MVWQCAHTTSNRSWDSSASGLVPFLPPWCSWAAWRLASWASRVSRRVWHLSRASLARSKLGWPSSTFPPFCEPPPPLAWKKACVSMNLSTRARCAESVAEFLQKMESCSTAHARFCAAVSASSGCKKLLIRSSICKPALLASCACSSWATVLVPVSWSKRPPPNLCRADVTATRAWGAVVGFFTNCTMVCAHCAARRCR
mmetsp:Transcript_14413/g.27705  ORF Transcript_14413/g.27705 Transcript_14413/m.27705 type:complete len:200 (-) Transcript_14413:68-667(-)